MRSDPRLLQQCERLLENKEITRCNLTFPMPSCSLQVKHILSHSFLDDTKLSSAQVVVPFAKHQLFSEKPRLKNTEMSHNLPDFLHGKLSSAPWEQTSGLPLLSSRLFPSWAQDSRRSWYCSWKTLTYCPWCLALSEGGHSLSEVPWAGLEGLTLCYPLPASTWRGPGGGDDEMSWSDHHVGLCMKGHLCGKVQRKQYWDYSPWLWLGLHIQLYWWPSPESWCPLGKLLKPPPHDRSDT